MPFPPVTSSIACPFCRQPITIKVRQIVDVGEEPQLKAELLASRLNSFTCPICKNSGALATPFLYHDAAKELALLFIPMALNVKEADQQRMIGKLTTAVMNNLPPEKRKAYLLQPQQFFNLKTLAETILQADGVTPEMLKAEQAKLELLQNMLDATDDAALDAIIKSHEAEIDLPLFQIFTSALAAASAERQRAEYDRLLHVRDRMFELTAVGQKLRRQQEVINGFAANPTRESLLAQLQQAEEGDVREALLTMGRSLLDYPFFQALTAKIDEATKVGNKAEADRLVALRKEILATRDKIDAQVQAEVDTKLALLRELIGVPANEIDQVIQKHLPEIDDLFLEILARNLQSAEQQGDAKALEHLQLIGDAAMRLVQSTQPPEIRFVNALVQAEYPNQTRELLERNKRVLVPEFIAWMENLTKDLRADGRAAAADRLVQVIAQAREVAGLSVAK